MGRLARIVRIGALIGASGLALSACASDPALLEPRFPSRTAQSEPERAHAPRTQPPAGNRENHTGGTWKPYQVNGRWYYPTEQPDYDEKGLASWYGDAFNGKPTANGELFDMTGLSAAHKTLPLPSLVEVTNLDNGRKIQVRVNDRGPFVDNRVIDLSRGAADELDMRKAGLAHVRVRYLGPADQPGNHNRLQYAEAAPVPRQPPTPLTPIPEFPPYPAQPGLDILLAQVKAAPRAPLLPPLSTGRVTIQAGAFSIRANAEKAANQLAGVGEVQITPLDRAGSVLYRVSVRPSDGSTAGDALQQLAGIGYRDAKIIASD